MGACHHAWLLMDLYCLKFIHKLFMPFHNLLELVVTDGNFIAVLMTEIFKIMSLSCIYSVLKEKQVMYFK
jgi:hypothetical protein